MPHQLFLLLPSCFLSIHVLMMASLQISSAHLNFNISLPRHLLEEIWLPTLRYMCLTWQRNHELYTYMAEWTLHPRVSGGLVLSVQCESRVKYLGITTCCPTLWLRDNATLKLYRFRWRIRTLRDTREGQMLISRPKSENRFKIQVYKMHSPDTKMIITSAWWGNTTHLLSGKRRVITLLPNTQLSARCRLCWLQRPPALICITLLCSRAEVSSSYQTHYFLLPSKMQ